MAHAAVATESNMKKVYRDPPPVTTVENIPERRKNAIIGAIQQVFGIDCPRDFQLEAINHCAGNNDTFLNVIRRTADGKSLIPLTVSLIRNGISIVLVPLHGLGSNQVKKANIPEYGVEAHYVDEHKYADADALQRRLLKMTKAELQENTVILFISPNSLGHDSAWYKDVLTKLSKRGAISSICIDKAHSIEQSGRSFRTEFIDEVKNLNKLSSLMPTPVPRIAMSATLRQVDRDRITTLLGDMKPNIMHGSLARRGTVFSCFVLGDCCRTFKKSAEAFHKAKPTKQQLWYYNSASKAEGAALDSAEDVLERHVKRGNKKTTCHLFTGGDGIMMKSSTMDAFIAYTKLYAKLHQTKGTL